jgi:hypothetical protein
VGTKERLRQERREQEANARPQSRRVPPMLIVAALAGVGVLGVLAYRARHSEPIPNIVSRPPAMPTQFPGRGRAGRRSEPAIPGMTINDDISVLVDRYGKPDADLSTAGMTPPPPIVTRRITYQKQRVTAVYRQDGSSWKLVGFVDPDTNKGVPPKTAYDRMNPKK